MLKLYKVYIRTMSSQNKQSMPSLSSKLAKFQKVVKPKLIVNQEIKLQDIEDLPGGSAALYFSPRQTRKQRQSNTAVLKTDLPAKKARQIGKEEAPINSKATKTKIGSATIVECAVVPKYECDNKIDVNSIKAEKESFEIVPKLEHVDKIEVSSIKTELESPKKVPKCEPANGIKTEVDSPNANWCQQLENVRLMRSERPAPVDTQGCHQCADKNADEKTQRFHKLVALMLSSQTKDETTYEAMNRLKARSLTPANIQQMPVAELEKLLHPVSFYKNKAKYVKQTAQILIDKYNEDIPDNIKELLKLPGVGPKMAHICMATAWNQITGIGVDTHVHRICNRLAWLKKPTKEPEQTRVQLESWLPQELWAEVNHLFVGFGQTICTPLRPNCEGCLNRDICAASTAAKKK
ncbi:endonuclease III-like protein 1 [Drosophila albomicans]|uniref:Endonuclease III homolog n=1 Tax=Drosophila albomicans TaxID=7291 RepID=A0A6P8WA72_DROAB|nr:endonuclease III-like protein 1 [Drosophila albomicans]